MASGLARAPSLTASERHPGQHTLTGTSSFLPERVRGTSAMASSTGRAMPGRELGPDRPRDPVPQAVVQLHPGPQDHKQQQPALAAGVADVDDQAVDGLVQALYDPVELGRAHADAARLRVESNAR